MGSLVFFDYDSGFVRSSSGDVDPIVYRLRAAGRTVEVLGPGEQRDEWQLWVDGVVMATGYCYGSFEASVVRYMERVDAHGCT